MFCSLFCTTIISFFLCNSLLKYISNNSFYRRIRPAQRKRAADEGLEGGSVVKRSADEGAVSSPSPSESPNLDPRSSALLATTATQSAAASYVRAIRAELFSMLIVKQSF